MNKNIIIILISIVSFSCSSKQDSEVSLIDTLTVDSTIILNADTLAANSDGALQNDDLIFTWDNDLKNLTKSELLFSSIKKPHANAYIDGQVDTIEVFTYKESNIEIYHAKDKDILVSSDIRNKELSLSNGIGIGVSRQYVQKNLKTQSNKDTLRVSDFEGNTSAALIFTNDILTRIIYSAYVE